MRNPRWFQALDGFTLCRKFWDVAAPHDGPTSSPLPTDANLQFCTKKTQNSKILTFLCLHPDFFLSLGAGSAFPSRINPRSGKFSRLSRCSPQISCPPFTSSPWPPPQCTDSEMFLFSFPFNSKSFPLDLHNSEITGTRCCFSAFPFHFQITSKL